MKNIEARHRRLCALRAQLSALDGRAGPSLAGQAAQGPSPRHPDSGPFPGIRRGAVHDLYAATAADAVPANGFALGLAAQAAAGRPIVWAVQDFMACEAGVPYGPGLREMGLDPAGLLLVRARDAGALLWVGEDALRSPTVGAVLLSAWGEAAPFGLTASRRLALIAQSGGGIVFVARAGASPAPSAAQTRWSVRAAASAPLEAGAPGRPAFAATLLRHRGGDAPGAWILEWDRDRTCFTQQAAFTGQEAPLPGGLVPVPAQRPAATAAQTRARRVA